MKLHIIGIGASIALLTAWTHPATPVHHDTTYSAVMNAAQATPPLPGNASGRATLTLSGNTIHYEITVSDLSGPATMAHIHVGQAGVAGPPVYTFKIEKVGSGKLAEGDIDLTKPASKTVSGDSLRVLLDNGSAYINVHTAAHPGGEIRGQVVRED